MELVDPQVLFARLVHGALEISDVVDLLDLGLNSVADSLRQSVSEHRVEDLHVFEAVEGTALEYDYFVEEILM